MRPRLGHQHDGDATVSGRMRRNKRDGRGARLGRERPPECRRGRQATRANNRRCRAPHVSACHRALGTSPEGKTVLLEGVPGPSSTEVDAE